MIAQGAAICGVREFSRYAARVASRRVASRRTAQHSTAQQYSRETRAIDALGKSRHTEYDDANNVSTRIDALGYRTRYEYDERNNLAAKVCSEAGQETRYAYGANNNRIGETWANSRMLSISYDVRDRRHVTSDARGVVETRTWRSDGQLKSVTDAEGRVASSTTACTG